MSVYSDLQQHDMECVRIEQNDNRDLVFEFVCHECGYNVVLPLFKVLARGNLNVSHAGSTDELPSLLITLQEKDIELPQSFKDFFEALEGDD